MDCRRKWKTEVMWSYVGVLLLCFILPASAHYKRYRESCSMDTDCDTGFCHPMKKTCECPTIKDYNSGKKVDQIYDNDLTMCLSRVGQLCSLEEVDHAGLTPIRCIPDAMCTVSKGQLSGKPSSQYFGACHCKLGFTPSESGRRCISNAELRTIQAPAAMDQTMEGYRGGGSVQSVSVKSNVAYSLIFVLVLSNMLPLR